MNAAGNKRFIIFQIFCVSFLCLCISAYAQDRIGEEINKAPTAPASLSILPIDGVSITPNTLVEKLIGTGVSYTNVSYTGANQASGIFSGGNTAGIAVDTGVILSSGLAMNSIGPNQSASITANNGLPGDVDLDNMGLGTTYDATVLEFDFVPTEENLEIRFVFGSDEYNEFVTSSYNDVFAFFLDGTNIALIPSTTTPVSINNVNYGYAPAGQLATGPCMNCSYYVDNATGIYDTEMDGYTTLIIGTATVVPGNTHHIKLAVADVADGNYDSWVMIEAKSFGAPQPVPISNWSIILTIGLISIAIWFGKSRLN